MAPRPVAGEGLARAMLRDAVRKRDATGASIAKHDDQSEVDVGAAIDAIVSTLAAHSSAPTEGEVRTDAEIVEQANDLAREFYSRRGYDVPAGYRFDHARPPFDAGGLRDGAQEAHRVACRAVRRCRHQHSGGRS